MLRQSVKQALQRWPSNNYRTLNRLEISRDNLLNNLALIQKQHPDKLVIPVLKGNAYGHGLMEVAKILNDADCKYVAVDGYFEAAKIRHFTRHRILVMGYILPDNAHLLDTKRCSFVVQDIAGLQAFGRLNRPVRIHLELETGMYRLGLKPAELEEYLKVFKQYPKLQLEGVMTHLADADNSKTRAYTLKQVKAFDQAIEKILKSGFKPSYFHIAQTAGSTKARSRYANALRLGIGLYGINPLSPEDKNFSDLGGLRPVMQLKSTIIKTYDLKKGDKVSYNGIFTASAKMRIATLPLGYYESVPRELSDQGFAMSGDKVLPIRGRVCMNHTMVDITGTGLKVGDEVVVVGSDPSKPNSIAFATKAYDIFSYSWLTNLSESVRRVIV